MMGYRAARLWRQLSAVESLETMIEVNSPSEPEGYSPEKPKPKKECEPKLESNPFGKRVKSKKDCVKVEENFSIPLL